MAAMLQLEIPHINVLTKIDLLSPRARDDLEAYLDPDPDFLLGLLSERTTAKHHRLNRAMANLVRDFSLVRFFPLTQARLCSCFLPGVTHC